MTGMNYKHRVKGKFIDPQNTRPKGRGMFKIGDWVLVRDLSIDDGWYLREVSKIDDNGDNIHTNIFAPDNDNGINIFFVSDDEVRALSKASKLNKKLYPSYVECDGYLVAPELRDEIKEED